MKNQYVGDIGDYTKLGLMRALQNTNLSLGLNWYLTPNDDKPDGRHVSYLRAKCDTPDTQLYSILGKIVNSDLRTVTELENRGILPDTVFFNEVLDFQDCTERQQARDSWHTNALDILGSQEIIFLDPDNGLEVKSNKPYSKDGNKYATYQEVTDYYINGASVVVYNHRDRSPEPQYIERFTRFKDMPGVSSAELLCMKAPRFSVRDYLFLMQPTHSEPIRQALDAMLSTGWRRYLSYRDI